MEKPITMSPHFAPLSRHSKVEGPLRRSAGAAAPARPAKASAGQRKPTPATFESHDELEPTDGIAGLSLAAVGEILNAYASMMHGQQPAAHPPATGPAAARPVAPTVPAAQAAPVVDKRARHAHSPSHSSPLADRGGAGLALPASRAKAQPGAQRKSLRSQLADWRLHNEVVAFANKPLGSRPPHTDKVALANYRQKQSDGWRLHVHFEQHKVRPLVDDE